MQYLTNCFSIQYYTTITDSAQISFKLELTQPQTVQAHMQGLW